MQGPARRPQALYDEGRLPWSCTREKARHPHLVTHAGLVELGEFVRPLRSQEREPTWTITGCMTALPEIRLVETGLAATAGPVLAGYAVRHHDRGAEVRDQERGSGDHGPARCLLTYERRQPVEDVTNYCAKNVEAGNDLKNQVSRWLDNAATKNGELLAILWCAISRWREEIRRRVQSVIDRPDQEKDKIKPNADAHPLLVDPVQAHAPLVHDMLATLPNSDRWLKNSQLKLGIGYRENRHVERPSRRSRPGTSGRTSSRTVSRSSVRRLADPSDPAGRSVGSEGSSGRQGCADERRPVSARKG